MTTFFKQLFLHNKMYFKSMEFILGKKIVVFILTIKFINWLVAAYHRIHFE